MTVATTLFVVQSKSSAGTDQVNVQFVEWTTQSVVNGIAQPFTGAVQSFNRTLPQAEADAYEINSKWEQTLTRYEEPAAPVAPVADAAAPAEPVTAGMTAS